MVTSPRAGCVSTDTLPYLFQHAKFTIPELRAMGILAELGPIVALPPFEPDQEP